jgi:Uma2 family endonuclease
MAEAARKLWTLDEFLAFNDGTDRRYELIGGEIAAIAPRSGIHGALAARLGARITAQLRRPCEVVMEAGILLPERIDAYYQADLAVTCSGLTPKPAVPEPGVIVEVLSPSTAATDYLRKLPDYRDMPSVQDILLVSSTELRIEHWRREADGWKVRDFRGEGVVRLQSFDVEIAVAELYRDLLPDRRCEPGGGLSGAPETAHATGRDGYSTSTR